MLKKVVVPVAMVGLALAACDGPVVQPEDVEGPDLGRRSAQAPVGLSEIGAAVNAALESEGAAYRLGYAEWIAAPGSEAAGQTVFFNNRGNKQLFAHFVPGDTRRPSGASPNPNDIWWISDVTDGTATGVTLAGTQGAVDAAMATWQNQRCSTIPLVKVPDFGVDWGLVEFIFSGGAAGVPFWLADVTHSGFGAIDFALPPFVLGVAFTFWWVDGSGTPTDIDNNGKLDAALRDIYYNNNFSWAVDGVSNVDVQTVATHEAGHGLSQGHFGKLFRTDANGKFHFAPRAVMNAGYTGPQQALAGTDNGGHCSIWGSWPNN